MSVIIAVILFVTNFMLAANNYHNYTVNHKRGDILLAYFNLSAAIIVIVSFMLTEIAKYSQNSL